ncbi:uncharacterized protein BKA78DRAFT_305378 [Phyllosticta capitalensis]|uniref:uncharacterized protein n=1 Tax=Phyllosticta capitalensis TaxID=121624 RepID=UPI003130A1CB
MSEYCMSATLIRVPGCNRRVKWQNLPVLRRAGKVGQKVSSNLYLSSTFNFAAFSTIPPSSTPGSFVFAHAFLWRVEQLCASTKI